MLEFPDEIFLNFFEAFVLEMKNKAILLAIVLMSMHVFASCQSGNSVRVTSQQASISSSNALIAEVEIVLNNPAKVYIEYSTTPMLEDFAQQRHK
ncbi:MAG: hypothetical protein FVQ83_06120 [Chloroflexi bacterium]|nr:hypothetical protein [Chloroflexota bacterium]